jgi:hypothetical protein
MQKLLILVAGPYRSGTNDDPARIAENLHLMTETALRVYERGHLPVLGEWFALPLLDAGGPWTPGDERFNAIFHPVSVDILHRCDAVLRTGGPSAGADRMVAEARAAGKRVFLGLHEVPGGEA